MSEIYALLKYLLFIAFQELVVEFRNLETKEEIKDCCNFNTHITNKYTIITRHNN